jgi:GH25 family lysozyme M1 (1,4-beta-N-acetylmuramidase)
VYSLAVQADGKILVGGLFTTLGGQPRNYLGRLNNTSPATQSLTFDSSTITWLRGGTSPEVWRTTFEFSASGIDSTSLGAGTRTPSGWHLNSVSLPSANGTIRARGYVTGGVYDGSCWFVESDLQVGTPPAITSLSPNPVIGANSRQTITINGANFVNKPTVTLTWTGQPGYTVPDSQVTFVNSMELQISITTTTTPDTWTVRVTNPDGQSSSAVGFQVLAAGGRFYLSFPLPNRDAVTAKINTVFDHSMTSPYTADGIVTAYTGEQGRSQYGQDYVTTINGNALYGFKNSSGTNFAVNGNYAGGGSPSNLYYDGHPGIDYRTTDQAPNGQINVLAAAAGVAHCVTPSSNNTIYVDHGNGYTTHYLHLSQRIVSDAAPVSRGQIIGVSGDTGSPGSPHLHFEVHLNGVPVDPYGWQGAGPDPYAAASNVNLWTAPSIYGVDVSSFQGTIMSSQWTQAKNEGKTFAWVRATKGKSDSAGDCEFIDRKFDANATAASAAGLTVGAYHVGNVVQYTAVDEADFFVSVAGNYIKLGNLRPVLDLESHSCGDPASLGLSGLAAWVDQWMAEVRALTGVTPIIYCNRSYLPNLDSSLAQKYDLWIASFTDDPESSIDVTPWAAWTAFQYSKTGSAGGVSPIDLDVFYGTAHDFQTKIVIPGTIITGVGGGGLQPPSGGQFQFGVYSTQPQVIIQASEDLVNWADVQTVTTVNGTGTFNDPGAGAYTKRFYRPKP